MLDDPYFDVTDPNMKSAAASRRPYRQTARAAAAEETRQRILQAFVARLRLSWFDEITLDAIAQEAGVTVQTVVRRFASKEGLLEAAVEWMAQEIHISRKLTDTSPAAVATVLARDYENHGELVLRLLDQEGRHPALRLMCDVGRREHRAWLASVFEEALQGPDAEPRLDALVVATDLYTWKLIRRDMGRPVRTYRQIVETLVAAALAFTRSRTA
jgi:AcrR family transcriptional regulator